MARSLRRRNEKAPRTKLLDSRQTRRHPERDTRHGRTMDIQIQTGRDRSPLQGLSSQPLCSKGLHPNQERSLLRKLCPSSIFRHTPPGLRPNGTPALPRQSLRRVSGFHRKRTR